MTLITKRENYLDIAKGIGIFLVVFAHTYRGYDLKVVIYSFHMPLFFFISGMFFDENKFYTINKFLNSKFKTLILPYITFYLISFIYWILIERHIRPGGDIPYIRPLIGFVYGTDYKDFMYPNGALWFLIALFCCEFILYLMLRYNKGLSWRLIITFLVGLIGYILSLYDLIPLPFSLSSTFMAFVFVSLGFLLKNKSKIIKDTSNLTLLIIFTFFFAIIIIASNYNGMIDMDYRQYQNPAIFILIAMVGIYATLIFSKIIKKNRYFQYWGVNTLIIMGLSEPLKRAVIAIFSKIIHIPIDYIRNSILFSLICVLIVFVCFIPIIYIFNTYLPIIIGKKKIIDKK